MTSGWICPRCGTVWAPSVTSCTCRPPSASTVSYTLRCTCTEAYPTTAGCPVHGVSR